MATIAHDRRMTPGPETTLPDIRQLEAVSFRSWPASTTRYDGTWAIRLTSGHPAKRLNSVNPLDPGDHIRLDERIERAARRFDTFGRPLIFRQSPLAPSRLDAMLDEKNWLRFDETLVMTLNLTAGRPRHTINRLPWQDRGHWIDQSIAMGSFPASVKPGLAELIASVEGEVALFLDEDANAPLAAAMAVRFGDLVGLFEVISNPEIRGHGFGRGIVENVLDWAAHSGATMAWLQVVASNEKAVGLYRSLGFVERYRYAYRIQAFEN